MKRVKDYIRQPLEVGILYDVWVGLAYPSLRLPVRTTLALPNTIWRVEQIIEDQVWDQINEELYE